MQQKDIAKLMEMKRKKVTARQKNFVTSEEKNWKFS